MPTKRESGTLRVRPGNDVQQSGCWDVPSSAMIDTCGHVKPALTGEPNNPSSDRTV